MRTAAPPLLPIFRSELQARLLTVLLDDTERPLTSRELGERTGGSAASLHRELRRLTDAGLLEEETLGRTKRYRAARDAPAFEPLRELVRRTLGVDAELARRLRAMEGIDFAAIHGSWARGEVGPTSDIDLLVVGDADPDAVASAVAGVERLAGREVNATVYARDEFVARRHSSGFLRTVLSRPLVALAGSLDDLRAAR